MMSSNVFFFIYSGDVVAVVIDVVIVFVAWAIDVFGVTMWENRQVATGPQP